MLKLTFIVCWERHQKKQVDLSLSIRLAGLSSGAKLELVQLSRSPSLVSVAIQLPEPDAQGIPNGRLVDKFPSSTTLWLILRKFESGVAGNGTTRNLTAKAVPTTSGESGAGRLFYQAPAIQVMDRELSSFTDLQKSLSQLGFNSGNTLLRLSFRTTDRPLEEAMVEIDEYFKSVDQEPSDAPKEETPTNIETPAASSASEPTETTPKSTPSNAEQPAPAEPATTTTTTTQQPPDTYTTEPSQPLLVSSRPVTVYAPPSGTTPQSAQTPYNEKDYVPTVEHAKTHQRRLNDAGKPGRLASDRELASQESAVQEKLASVTEFEVKVRFPDQSQVVSKFGKEDTASELYGFVRSCLDEGIVGERFSLWFFSGSTSSTTSQGTRAKTTIPDSKETYLIRDLRMDGRVLVNFVWDANAALSARSAGAEILRPDLRKSAGQIKVEDVGARPVEEEEADSKSWLRKMAGGGEGDSGSGGASGAGGGSGKKVPKWLKLPGKK